MNSLKKEFNEVSDLRIILFKTLDAISNIMSDNDRIKGSDILNDPGKRVFTDEDNSLYHQMIENGVENVELEKALKVIKKLNQQLDINLGICLQFIDISKLEKQHPPHAAALAQKHNLPNFTRFFQR